MDCFNGWDGGGMQCWYRAAARGGTMWHMGWIGCGWKKGMMTGSSGSRWAVWSNSCRSVAGGHRAGELWYMVGWEGMF
jgi:hypothetical protein